MVGIADTSGALFKTCTKCGVEKPIESFKKDSTKKDGLYSSCKECNNWEWRENYPSIAERHREKNKIYAENNKDRIKKYLSRYYYANRYVHIYNLNEKSC